MTSAPVPLTGDSTGDASVRPPHEVAAGLGVDPAVGLSAAEAARRLAEDGPNELRATTRTPWWRRLLRQFQDPLVYLLLAAMVISFLAWWAEGGHGAPIDVIVIGAIVVLNAGIGFVQENRAQNAADALATMTAVTSTVLRDGRLVSLPSADLVRGDVLVLSEGDAVGADARLVQAAGLTVQEASLTGESVAIAKDAATLDAVLPLADRINCVFKGTGVVSGVGRAVVTATGPATQVGRIADLLDATQDKPTPLQREVATISRSLGVIVLGIAAVVMAALALISGVHDPSEAVGVLLIGVSLAVAAVPEGLPAILSLVLALGVQDLAAHKAVMKRLHSVETLGSASVICSDKTGTLTRNEMTLKTVVTASGQVELTGTGYAPEGGVEGEPDPGAIEEARRVLAGGVLANNAQLDRTEGTWQITGDPTEASFLVAQHKVAGTAERAAEFERMAEVPFTSERKLMSVLARQRGAGRGVLAVKGAPDVLLTRCRDELRGDAVAPLDEGRRRALAAVVERLSGEGYRTLGVAFREFAEVPDGVDEAAEQGLTFLGVVGIIDPPRDEARDAVAQAHRAGVRVVMITGDHPVTAARIATDLGIIAPGERALSGAELDALDEDALRAAAREVSVYARVAPEHKLRIVDALQREGHIVAMTGDGVNDAPALKAADIGVAMGITGTEVTKEAGTMILGDDNFATIVTAVRRGRAIFANIKKFMRYLLSSNMGEVATVFFGIVLAAVIGLSDASDPGGLALPLLATQILWINLVTDSGPALAMGVEPEDDDIMDRPPRRLTDRIIDRAMWVRIVVTGLVLAASTLATLDLFLPGGLIPADAHDLATARTAAFTTLVFGQLFNALNARSETHSAFSHLFTNRWLWASLLVGAALQVAVVEVGVLQTAFGTTHLSPEHWLIAVGLGSVVLWFEEGAKLVRRIRRRKGWAPR